MDVIGDYTQQIKDICLQYFDSQEEKNVFELSNEIMDIEGLPMHCPPHHFMMPAVLLTICSKKTGRDKEQLEADLDTAKKRSVKIAGGFCGNYGNCGAAVGIGIFLSIFTGTTPLSTTTWSQVNMATGRGLVEIASVEGPRCCKRNTYLALYSAIDTIKEYLDIELEKPEKVVCKYHTRNKECKGTKCPFFLTSE